MADCTAPDCSQGAGVEGGLSLWPYHPEHAQSRPISEIRVGNIPQGLTATDLPL